MIGDTWAFLSQRTFDFVLVDLPALREALTSAGRSANSGAPTAANTFAVGPEGEGNLIRLTKIDLSKKPVRNLKRAGGGGGISNI